VIDAMLEAQSMRTAQAARTEAELDKITKLNDLFLDQIEKDGNDRDNFRVNVYCAYMRLGDNDPLCARYTHMFQDLRNLCSCTCNQMDPKCKLVKVNKIDRSLFVAFDRAWNMD
jgi:hypothetical protein